MLSGSRLLERGSGVEQALELLAERFRWILVASAAGIDSELLEVAASMRERVARIASQSDTAFCAHAIALCDATARNARGSSAPRALYDACLARLALAQRFASGAALLAAGASSSSSGLGGGTGLKKASAPVALPATAVLRVPGAVASEVLAPPLALPPVVAVPSATTLAELLARLEVIAAKSAKDHSLMEGIDILEFTGETARVGVRIDEGGGRYLVTNPDPIRTLLSRAAGRPLRVTIETTQTQSAAIAPQAANASDPALRNEPLIRKALELFNASIVAVSARAARDDNESAISSETDDTESNT